MKDLGSMKIEQKYLKYSNEFLLENISEEISEKLTQN